MKIVDVPPITEMPSWVFVSLPRAVVCLVALEKADPASQQNLSTSTNRLTKTVLQFQLSKSQYLTFWILEASALAPFTL